MSLDLDALRAAHAVQLNDEHRRRLERFHRQVRIVRESRAVRSNGIFEFEFTLEVDTIRREIRPAGRFLDEEALINLATNLRPFWMQRETVFFQGIRGILWQHTTTIGGRRLLSELADGWRNLLNGQPPFLLGTVTTPPPDGFFVEIGAHRPGQGLPENFVPHVSTNEDVMNLLLYGRVAHVDDDELVERYDAWTSDEACGNMWCLFHDVLRRLTLLVFALDNHVAPMVRHGREMVFGFYFDHDGHRVEHDLTTDTMRRIDAFPEWAERADS